MRTTAVTPEIFAAEKPQDDTAVPISGTGTDAAHRLAAHLAGLDLDAETLELLLAALTTDVCDHLAIDSTDELADA
jgi:hypothetical protein